MLSKKKQTFVTQLDLVANHDRATKNYLELQEEKSWGFTQIMRLTKKLIA